MCAALGPKPVVLHSLLPMYWRGMALTATAADAVEHNVVPGLETQVHFTAMRGSCYHACNDIGMTCAGRFEEALGSDVCANYDAGTDAGRCLLRDMRSLLSFLSKALDLVMPAEPCRECCTQAYSLVPSCG